jgi:protein SCO1
MRGMPPLDHVGSDGRARALRLLTAVVVAAASAGLVACGSNVTTGNKRTGPSSRTPAAFAGSTYQTPASAAPLRLRDSLGRIVNLRRYRGKAVLVTFIYTHCPDVCPLIVGNLHSVQAQLGPEARKLQIVAVSTDPRGDTPATVRRFLRQHAMTGRMEYLLGSSRQLERVWKAWGIVAKRDKKTAEFVEHSALIYGIGASGRLLTLYPSNFKPASVVHDVPLLAAR